MQQSILALLTAGVIAMSTVTVPAQAESRDYRRDQHRDSQQDRRSDQRRDYRQDHRGDQRRDSRQDHRGDQRRDYRHDRRSDQRRDYRKHEKSRSMKSPIIHHGDRHNIPRHRIRRHRDIVVVRPFGHLYHGYGHYFQDDDAYKWLAFTAIAVKLLDNLNEQQQREHEAAQVRATTAPIGETIYWHEGNASGYVTATREGSSSAGRYCREFQHEVTIGGQREKTYGTACRQPDGSWELISTGQ
ncbi:MAG: hypothetical protein OEM43_02740 [Gammaproteobacteria bacterium]|nr:hypothetical protein [Gammaproteobacteria bacterium]